MSRGPGQAIWTGTVAHHRDGQWYRSLRDLKVSCAAAGQGGHHLLDKQFHRAQPLRVRHAAPGEGTDDIVAAARLYQSLGVLANPGRRAEEDGLVLDGGLPRKEAVDTVVIMVVP